MMQSSHPPIENKPTGEKHDSGKKRALRITLIVIVIIVIAIGIAGCFFFTSPFGQAWTHDWIENPNGLTVAAAVVTAIATVLAAVATFCAVLVALFGMRNERIKAQEDRKEAQTQFLAEQQRAHEVLEDERTRFTEAQEVERERFKAERAEFEKAQEESRKQFLEAQKQAQAAQEESRKQFLEAQYAASRPLLVPATRYSMGGGLTMENAGTGVAINIWAVFMPVKTSSKFRASVDNLPTPLLGGKREKIDMVSGTTLTPDTVIGENPHTLGIPKIFISSRYNRYSGRLTLTYSDIFGRKHASIFNYTIGGTWVDGIFISDIKRDLGEMETERRMFISLNSGKTSLPDETSP